MVLDCRSPFALLMCDLVCCRRYFWRTLPQPGLLYTQSALFSVGHFAMDLEALSMGSQSSISLVSQCFSGPAFKARHTGQCFGGVLATLDSISSTLAVTARLVSGIHKALVVGIYSGHLARGSPCLFQIGVA